MTRRRQRIETVVAVILLAAVLAGEVYVIDRTVAMLDAARREHSAER